MSQIKNKTTIQFSSGLPIIKLATRIPNKMILRCFIISRNVLQTTTKSTNLHQLHHWHWVEKMKTTEAI